MNRYVCTYFNVFLMVVPNMSMKFWNFDSFLQHYLLNFGHVVCTRLHVESIKCQLLRVLIHPKPCILCFAISWQWRKHSGAACKRVHTLFLFLCACEPVCANSLVAHNLELCFTNKHDTSLPGDGETENRFTTFFHTGCLIKTYSVTKCLEKGCNVIGFTFSSKTTSTFIANSVLHV